ncbi:SpoIIE family protein phosphatase [Solirubrobacter sp. CPCC 204708]|uniref:SpoIIE family protein phosphatase n=1 Tax=Solirubrobacter deserti TaxID=2282478 RepID=A0ABT4RCD4_9ACTN|nr:SpoIIE family protein phosphatase [Solirubrobacter deserti]MBE2315563.1 SpoIIE family protein phosphatase [Solirubrobacter deserti]MDA0136202.1 SpoIIE family protein phosphatase [Solirubrobacter deserti]
MRGSTLVAALGVALVAALTVIGVPPLVNVAVALAVLAALLHLAAGERRALAGDHERYALIRGAAVIADSDLTVAEVIERLTALLTPGYATRCEVDLETTEPPRHRPQALTVPLVARGRDIGTLRLTATERTYAPEELEFAQLLAGRVALALENAQLQRVETRLTAALDTLAEAVTIQDPSGRLIYANQAAALAVGFDTPEAFLATPLEQVAENWDTYTEAGTPVPLERLPGHRLVRGETPEPLLIRTVRRDIGAEYWRILKATAAPGGYAVNVIEDVTEVKRAEHAQRFLAQAGALLASSLDYEQTLNRIARLAVPRLADWCNVTMPSGEHLRSVALVHVDPEMLELAHEYQERYPARLDAPGAVAVLNGTSLRVNDITDEVLKEIVSDPEQRVAARRLGLRAFMAVPMLGSGGPIGSITFASAESGRTFSEDDLRLAEDLGRRAGIAVENARLYRERSEIATTLQRGLLPDALPTIPGLRLSSLYRPAGLENLVGGDFYDAFPTDAGWMLLVGDVTGRGAAAAAQTGQARHTLRTAGRLLSDPAAALQQLNHTLADRKELTPCTVAVVHVTAQTTDVLCAGHPRPLLIRDGEPRPVGHFGPMLGAWSDSRWKPDSLAFEPGDVLVLYTDGVTDAEGEHERFGDERLVEALRGVRDATSAVAAIDRALNAFQRGAQADDTAVLAIDQPVKGG